MICEHYNLPEITIIGGDTFPICFDLFRDARHSIPFEMADATSGKLFKAYFSMVEYLNRDYDAPVLSFASTDASPRISITSDDDGTSNNVVVQFQAIDTANMSGKYIYQITLKDDADRAEVLGQGTMTIIRNIHPDLIY